MVCHAACCAEANQTITIKKKPGLPSQIMKLIGTTSRDTEGITTLYKYCHVASVEVAHVNQVQLGTVCI